MDEEPTPPDENENIAVDDTLRKNVTRRLKGCHRIAVQRKKGRSSWTSIVSWKLDSKADSLPTEPEPDEIIQKIQNAIHEHWEEENEDSDELEYRVWMNSHQTTARGNLKDRELSFQYVYAGEDEGGESRDADDRDADEAEAKEQLEADRASLFRTMLTALSNMGNRLDESHVHIQAISAQAQALSDPLTKMFGFMTSSWLTGVEMQRRAQELMFDIKKVREEELAKERRLDKYAMLFGPALQVGVMQFMQQIASKRGIKLDFPDPTAAKTEQNHADPTPKTKAKGTKSDGPPMEEDDEMAHARANPCATMAQSLGSTIRPEQWPQIYETFNKREAKMLAKLFSSMDDEECIANWDKLADGVPMHKLAALALQLHPQQREAFTMMRTMITKAKAGWEDEDEDDDQGDDGDDGDSS